MTTSEPGLLPPLDRAARDPAFADATRHFVAGALDAARGRYLALADRPELLAPCLYQLALIAAAQSDTERATVLLTQALTLEPGLMAGYRTLAGLQERAGQVGAAMATLLSLGNSLKLRERNGEAMAVYRQILERDPLNYAAAVNLGTVLVLETRFTEAARYLLWGLRLYGRQYPAFNRFLDQLLALFPESAGVDEVGVPPGAPNGGLESVEGALVSLGRVFKEQGHLDAALACYRHAVAEAPGYALAHWNLSLLLLTQGEFSAGWREYEWRWRWPEFPEQARRLPAPLWQGEPLAGQRILVWSEQGLGDNLQFVPLLSRLVTQGAEVVLEVPRTLVRLMDFNLPGVRVIHRPNHPDTVNSDLAFHYVVPMMSLPERLALSEHELPLARRYLRPLPDDLPAWQKRVPPEPTPRIGLVWAGNPSQSNDAVRSLPHEVVRGLLDVPGVRWYSLQVGPRQAELQQVAAGSVTDLAPNLKDFADTAAAVAQLDAVVTVDTSVAHLAGAMAKPVWVLLSRPCDWRWGWEGESCPWYPTARLFRQSQPGQWDVVAAALRGALSAFSV